jgi:hypothetical protein
MALIEQKCYLAAVLPACVAAVLGTSFECEANMRDQKGARDSQEHRYFSFAQFHSGSKFDAHREAELRFRATPRRL